MQLLKHTTRLIGFTLQIKIFYSHPQVFYSLLGLEIHVTGTSLKPSFLKNGSKLRFTRTPDRGRKSRPQLRCRGSRLTATCNREANSRISLWYISDFFIFIIFFLKFIINDARKASLNILVVTRFWNLRSTVNQYLSHLLVKASEKSVKVTESQWKNISDRDPGYGFSFENSALQ